jgi:hypothetical protein
MLEEMLVPVSDAVGLFVTICPVLGLAGWALCKKIILHKQTGMSRSKWQF